MKLIRGITRWDLVFLMLNATIGGGIYGLPSEVFAKSGSYSLLAMLVCVFVISLIVLCFAEMVSKKSSVLVSVSTSIILQVSSSATCGV